ncbi:MAG: hypothetical protein KatS3mg003_1338 [Candidatus Nitrosocaldaceae archaeon]|nr:MAG: hypothetical protein KatS3mg003_1338 [Candidatus Nitrosocaldaceae archaeon]
MLTKDEKDKILQLKQTYLSQMQDPKVREWK